MQQQLTLPMFTVYEGPRLVALELVDACKTFREAVRTCWQLRTRRSLTLRQLAEEAALYASHVSDYLAESDTRRELPARHINAFELACGNRIISQWMARQAQLTILEQFIEHRRAA